MVFPQNLCESQHSTWKYTSKRSESRDSSETVCTPISIFSVVNGWKPPKHPRMKDWINTMWYLHTMECYLASKRKEILAHPMVEEFWRLQKDKSQTMLLTWVAKEVLCTDIESKRVFVGAWQDGREAGEWLFNGCSYGLGWWGGSGLDNGVVIQHE